MELVWYGGILHILVKKGREGKTPQLFEEVAKEEKEEGVEDSIIE